MLCLSLLLCSDWEYFRYHDCSVTTRFTLLGCRLDHSVPWLGRNLWTTLCSCLTSTSKLLSVDLSCHILIVWLPIHLAHVMRTAMYHKLSMSCILQPSEPVLLSSCSWEQGMLQRMHGGNLCRVFDSLIQAIGCESFAGQWWRYCRAYSFCFQNQEWLDHLTCSVNFKTSKQLQYHFCIQSIIFLQPGPDEFIRRRRKRKHERRQRDLEKARQQQSSQNSTQNSAQQSGLEKWRTHPIVGGLIPLNAAGKYVCPPLVMAGRAAVRFWNLIITSIFIFVQCWSFVGISSQMNIGVEEIRVLLLGEFWSLKARSVSRQTMTKSPEAWPLIHQTFLFLKASASDIETWEC